MTFLDRELVKFQISANNPEEAIYETGKLLLEGGFIEEKYIEAMIDSYLKNGAYFVIAPGIAIPHARPEDGAISSAISLCTLEEPVAFGHETNDPVKFVFGLSSSTGKEHLEIIQLIVRFLRKKGTIEKLQHIKNYQEFEELKEEMG